MKLKKKTLKCTINCIIAFLSILTCSYGRKIVFVLSILFMAITGIGQALSTSYAVFNLFAFLNAVGTAGVFPLAFILGNYDG